MLLHAATGTRDDRLAIRGVVFTLTADARNSGAHDAYKNASPLGMPAYLIGGRDPMHAVELALFVHAHVLRGALLYLCPHHICRKFG
jgi:hypothetical protein